MGFLDSISNIISAPAQWLGDAVEWTGQRTGIKPLESAGNWMTTPQGSGLTTLAASLALPWAAPTLWNSLPASITSMFPAAATAAEGAAATGASGSILPSLTSGTGGLAVNMPGGAAALTGAEGALIPAASLGSGLGATAGAMTGAKNAAFPSVTGGTDGLAVNSPGGVSLTGSGGALLPMGNAGSPGFLSSLMNSGKSMFPSALGGTGKGMSSWMVPAMGLGIGSDYFAQKANAEQEEGSKAALNSAIAANSWTPERRAEYMKGINAELQGQLAGAKRRAAGSAAARGAGGGSYGGMMQDAYSDAMSSAAKGLGATYAPDTNLIPFMAQANSPTRSATSRWLSDLTNLAGSAGSNMLTWSMLKDIMGRA